MESTPLAIYPAKVGRKSAGYHPTLWGDFFATYKPTSLSQQACTHKSDSWIRQRIEELKEEVRGKLVSATDLVEKFRLIDAIQHLGIAYHFEKEIDEVLSHAYDAKFESSELDAVSLRFRLLRQQGYRVPADEFSKFKDGNSSFKATLADDPRGLLSLYNAAYLGIHGEDILEEAILFTKNHLKSMQKSLEHPLAPQVSRFLETPLFRRMKRLEARRYISEYEAEDACNNSVLELAKLDFNLVQSIQCEELKIITLWWKESDLLKLGYARDRIVECYFWIVGVPFEPHYSRSRLMTTKVIGLLSILDDTYDVYATLEECRQLTDAIQRWDTEAAEQLPEYLKHYFLKLVNTYKEFEDELAPEEKYRVSYLIEEIYYSYPSYLTLKFWDRRINALVLHIFCLLQLKKLAKCYLQEVEWYAIDFVPTFEEHLNVSLVTSGHRILACASFVWMDGVATKEVFEWVATFPDIVKASSMIGRFLDDIVSAEFERKRGHFVTLMDSYMKEYNTTEEVTTKKLQTLVEDSWKTTNQAFLKPTAVPMPILERLANYSRMIDRSHIQIILRFLVLIAKDYYEQIYKFLQLERKRGHFVTSMDNYMKEYNSTMEVATKKLQTSMEDAWKTTNQAFLKPTAVPMPILKRPANYSRMVEAMYKYVDSYTNSIELKDIIALLFLQRIPA
ncbi:alpha-humulene synthase-like [Typha angustifolia]|uniref:alpha-humulene synthase-like n=1 Tax=Typha angustifolia TaxID=59011 RepID=UPI003C2E01BE